MAPIPDVNTDKYFVDYSTAVNEHTLMVRAANDSIPANVDPELDAFFSQVGTFLSQITILRVRLQQSGSNFSTPVPMSITGKTYGGLPGNKEQDATSLTFVGRDELGVRGRMSLFGSVAAISNYRLTSGEDSQVAAIVNYLNASSALYLTITGNDPVWYDYIDIKPNDYWVRRAR